MKHSILNRESIAGILCVGALLFTSCRSAGRDETASDTVSGATPVKVFKIRRERISEKLSYTGTLEAWKKINITPEIGGKIARILVEEGDRVAPDQVLAELETHTYRLQLEQTEAAVAVAAANFEDARRNKERMERLVRESAVSEQQYEKIKLAFDAAEAQLAQARASHNLAQHALDISIMKAPFSGIIATRNAEVGDVINPMMGTMSTASGILTLVDYSKIKITVDVSPQDVERLAKGQAAVLRSSSPSGREFRGRVTIVNLTADPLSNKFSVEVAFDNPGLSLRPGTFGDVIFEVQAHENALVIPQKAVLENSYVFVVEGQKAVKKEVALGLQNTMMIEVLSGLSEGVLVIVDGNFGLEDGSAVEVIEEVN